MVTGSLQEEIIEEFESFEDRMEKYNYLIELSKDLKELDVKHRSDDNVISGCQSKVWLIADLVDDKLIENTGIYRHMTELRGHLKEKWESFH